MTGIGSYLTAPLWFLFLVLRNLISLQAQFVRPEFFRRDFRCSEMACPDPILGSLGLSRNDGIADRAEISSWILLATQPRIGSSSVRWFRTLAGLVIETFLSPDRARHDDLSIYCGRRDSARTRRSWQVQPPVNDGAIPRRN